MDLLTLMTVNSIALGARRNKFDLVVSAGVSSQQVAGSGNLIVINSLECQLATSPLCTYLAFQAVELEDLTAVALVATTVIHLLRVQEHMVHLGRRQCDGIHLLLTKRDGLH